MPDPVTESEIAEMKPAKDERGNPPNVPQGDDVMHLSRLANNLTIYLSPTERAMLRDAATALHWIRREAASWERVHVAFPRLAAAAREGIKAEKYRKVLEEIKEQVSCECDDGASCVHCLATQALKEGA